MALETVLLSLLGVVALWLAVDAGRERHRLRARMQRERAAGRARTGRAGGVAGTPAFGSGVAGTRAVGTDAAWRYWPLTVSSSDNPSIGPRL